MTARAALTAFASSLALSLTLVAAAPQADPVVALDGLDPVALCEGEEVAGLEAQVADHGRFRYRFASEETRARFLASPQRFAVQWDGACGRMGPLSGTGDPGRYAVVEGRIWLFASDGCREAFVADPAGFIEAPPAAPEVEPQAESRGRLLLARVVQAHGGEAAVDQLTGVHYSFEDRSDEAWTHAVDMQLTAGGELVRDSSWLPADRSAEAVSSMWVLGEDSEAYLVEDAGMQPLVSPESLGDLRRYAHRELLPLFWARDRDDLLVLERGESRFAGRAAIDLLLHLDGLATTLHVDAETSEVLGLSWRGRAAEGLTRDVVETFTEWSDVDDVKLPKAREVTTDGNLQAGFSTTWNEQRALVSRSRRRG